MTNIQWCKLYFFLSDCFKYNIKTI